MRVTIPAGAYLIIEDDEGRAAKKAVMGCEGVEGVRAAVLSDDGSVLFTSVLSCEEKEASMVMVRGRAFSTLVMRLNDLVLKGEGLAATPAPTALGRVRRFEYQHLAHVLGFALARSRGEGIENAWREYPGHAVEHAPKALLEKVGGVEEVLWGVALGGQADIEEFVSGLALGMGDAVARIGVSDGALQALTLALRRGGVRHSIGEGGVVIESVMDALISYREEGGVWVEPFEPREKVGKRAIVLVTDSRHPMIVGYIGWYLAK